MSARSHIRTAVFAVLVVMALPAAAQAPPKPWTYCNYGIDNSPQRHGTTPVFGTPLDPDWRKEFEAITLDKRSSTVGCWSFDSAEEAAAQRQKGIDRYNSQRFYGPRSVIVVAPPPGARGVANPVTPSGAPAVAGGGGALTVVDNGNAARIAAWDNQVLQAQRVEAAAKVQRAIGTAESKAEYKRVLDELRAKLKLRGRSQ